jgi:hypothetical protein
MNVVNPSRQKLGPSLRNVVIPLGGVGSRFQTEGYLQRPKPFIPVLGTLVSPAGRA